MKYIITLLAIFIFATTSAQSDSTEIKLQKYKDMFVKGLITAQEYDQLKQQTLGIKTPAPQSVVILKVEKPKLDSAQLVKLQNSYQGLVGLGAVSITIGAGMIIGSAAYSKLAKNPNPVAVGVLAAFGVAATTLGIVSVAVGSHRKGKYMKATGQAYLNIGVDRVGIAYNF